MDDDASLRILVSLISRKSLAEVVEIMRQLPSDLTFFSEDFCSCTQEIIAVRRYVLANRWNSFFDMCFKRMMSSHQMYLTFVMFACIIEQTCHKNIFESLMDVCILVILLNNQTLVKTGVDFYPLNIDIIMVFYQNKFKEEFSRCGGFGRFVEFILSHRIVRGRHNNKNKLLPRGGIADAKCSIRISLKFEKEWNRERVKEVAVDPDEVAQDTRCIDLATAVLSIPSLKLPALPSYFDLVKAMVAFKKKSVAETAGELTHTKEAAMIESSNADLQESSSSIPDSKSNFEAKHQENIERYENIIKAVIKYNHSKNSGVGNVNSQIKEALGVLEYFKDNIKSLIEVIDEYDKE